MPTSSTPGPDHHSPLSSSERRILAGIEDQLLASDPGLARELRSRKYRRPTRWWPLSAGTTGLLLVALLVLVVVGAVVPASWWAVLGLATSLVVIPWLLLAAAGTNRSDGGRPA